MEMNLFKFLTKTEIQSLLRLHGLPTSGSLEKLRTILTESRITGLNYSIPKVFTKDRLVQLSEQLYLNHKGTKEEIIERILSVVPSKFIEEAPIVKFSNNGIKMFYYDEEFLLSTFFSREEIQNLLRNADLSPTGSKDVLIERYLSKAKPSLISLLEEMDSQMLSKLSTELDIPIPFLSSPSVHKIHEKIMSFPQRKKTTKLDSKIKKFEYDIALSFAGEERHLAKRLNELLKSEDLRTFYDKDHASMLVGENLIDKLAEIYGEKSRYCAIFISENYIKKQWTNHERIHAQARQLRNNSAYIIPLIVDNVELPGLPQSIGYIDLKENDLEFAAKTISAKIGH
jgi:hypothetical protein